MENNFKFYNTLTKKIETVIPHEDGKIAMYTCGPTVYHFAHIGNLRSYIMEDVLEKSLRYVGYDVKRVNLFQLAFQIKHTIDQLGVLSL